MAEGHICLDMCFVKGCAKHLAHKASLLPYKDKIIYGNQKQQKYLLWKISHTVCQP